MRWALGPASPKYMVINEKCCSQERETVRNDTRSCPLTSMHSLWHGHACTHTQTRAYTLTHRHMHAHSHIDTRTQTHARHTQTHAHTLTPRHMHAHSHRRMYAHLHTETRTHTHNSKMSSKKISTSFSSKKGLVRYLCVNLSSMFQIQYLWWPATMLCKKWWPLVMRGTPNSVCEASVQLETGTWKRKNNYTACSCSSYSISTQPKTCLTKVSHSHKSNKHPDCKAHPATSLS